MNLLRTDAARSRAWLAACSLLLLLLAAWRPLALPDEGRYGEIGRWMAQSGDWLVPRLNGLPFFHKPPLPYWLEAASVSMFGAHAWAVRLPIALHAIALLWAIYFGVRHLARRAPTSEADAESLARRAALMFGTSLAFLVGGQYVNHDMMVAVWIALAIGCFAFSLAFVDDACAARRLAWAGFAACGLGVMTKGLIGLALPGLVLVIWLTISRRWAHVLRLPWVSGVALFALIVLPWFVAVQARHPDLLGYMFGTHQFGRFTSKSFNNARPFWFYGLALVLLCFPWCAFALGEGVAVLRRRAASVQVPLAARQLAWTWLIAITVFFSIPNSKLVGYVLPVLPPLVLLAALGWQRWPGSLRLARPAGATFMTLAVLIGVTLTVVAGRYSLRESTRDVAPVLACLAEPGEPVLVAGNDFAYDLAFYARLTQPPQVVQDWPTLRRDAGDNWRRELFEAGDFDRAAAQRLLVGPDALRTEAQPGVRWLLMPQAESPALGEWQRVVRGRAWALWRASPEGPLPPEDKGLARCGAHAGDQRQP